MTINGLLSGVKKVNENLTKGLYLRDIFNDIEAATFVIERNTQDQLYEQGVNALGVEIASYRPYSPMTKRLKEEKNQPTDRVTLYDTGAFHHSFNVKPDTEGVLITADDWKTDELLEKYGAEIMGLTNANKSELAHKILLPDLLERIRKELKIL